MPPKISEGSAVIYLIAYLMFAVLAAAAWFVSIAIYRSTIRTPDPVAAPEFRTLTVATVLVVGIMSFLPMPLGYALGLVVWAVAAFTLVGLPPARAAALFALLAVNSFLTRLMVLGVLDLTT